MNKILYDLKTINYLIENCHFDFMRSVRLHFYLTVYTRLAKMWASHSSYVGRSIMC